MTKKKMKRGHLIEIFRENSLHWAIYIGRGEVVHLEDSDHHLSRVTSTAIPNLPPRAVVKREMLKDVVHNDSYKVNNSLDNEYTPRKRCIIMKEALEKVDQQLPCSVTSYNCEHFVTELRYGMRRSRQPGDLIEIFHWNSQHWAIYIGEGEVIHLVDSDDSSWFVSKLITARAVVKREKLVVVVGSHRYKVNNRLDGKVRPRNHDTIMREALEMVGQKLPYSVTSSNCERFVTELRYGKPESRQGMYVPHLYTIRSTCTMVSGDLIMSTCHRISFVEKNMEPGDLIKIFDGAHQHWAIYISRGEVVHLEDSDHYSRDVGNTTTAVVKHEKLKDVVGSNNNEVNNSLDHLYVPRKNRTIVKEALKMVGKELPYSVTCKDFVTDLRYGRLRSGQITMEPGDLIEIPRWNNQHWCVYVGLGEVVHLDDSVDHSNWLVRTCSHATTAEVKCAKIRDVVGSQHYIVRNLLDDENVPRERDIIVKDALNMVGLMIKTSNCERFVTDLRYGKPESRQVKMKSGDLIKISRGTFHHWAVYIGEGEVVHLVDSVHHSSLLDRVSGNPTRAAVKREKLKDVVNVDSYEVHNLLDDEFTPCNRDIIVKKARGMVGERLPYCHTPSNCERFVTELRYGEPQSRQPGDLIEIFRGSYQHWAVYIGGGEVVHVVNSDHNFSRVVSTAIPGLPTRAVVKCEKLKDVVGADDYKVNNSLDDKYKPHERDTIMKEALERVGQEVSYSVTSSNCEHFATKLRYGKQNSRQVAMAFAGALAGVAAGAMLTGVRGK